MTLALFNKKSRYMGIDISATAVKLVELSRTGGRFQIEAYGTEQLPEGAMDNRNPSDPAAVANASMRTAVPCARVATSGASPGSDWRRFPACRCDS